MKKFLLKSLESWISFFQIQKTKIKDKEIIFYLENSSDWLYLKYFYESLVNNSKRILIVSSDKENKFKDCKIDFYIGRNFARTFFFRLVNSKLFVLTMTDLDNFYLKKSLKVHKYVYIFHSLVSTHRVYRDKAFNNYDIIFCPTNYHYNEIKKTEKIYNLNPKKLIKYGYPRIKQLIQNNKTKFNSSKEKKVLIAPTWGESSILNYNILEIIELLLNNNFEVNLRLHPMTYRYSPKIINLIKNKFKKSNDLKFFFHENIYDDEIIYKCDILITEWSGIAFEFAFSNLKPIFFIDTPPKVNNPKWDEITEICFEEFTRQNIGYVISMSNYNDLIEKINSYYDNKIMWQNKIADFRDKVIYNIYDEKDVSFINEPLDQK